jgi:23S rRNA pseudouridine1911/1915/1917 synthase
MTQFPKINIIFENHNLIVIDKPAGLVVHPGAGEHAETLVDWLVTKYPEIKKLNWPDISRPGIVHRLDKDTSGLMILAKNPEALKKLQSLFRLHRVHKTYLALVSGRFEKPAGEIKSLIGRHPKARRKQVSRSIFFDFEPGKKREAQTQYQVLKEYSYLGQFLSLVEATLETGRTHQIRVQFKAIGHPVIGDPIYNTKLSRNLSKKLKLNRQFLHAYKLSFSYADQKLNFVSNIPPGLEKILSKIYNTT